MGRLPRLSNARRIPLPAGVKFHAAFHMTVAQSALEQRPPNPLTALRTSLGLRLEDFSCVTGLPPAVFLMIEGATPELSSRELMALRRAYDEISGAYARGERTKPSATRRQAWRLLNELSDQIDAQVAAGRSAGNVFIETLRPWLDRSAHVAVVDRSSALERGC